MYAPKHFAVDDTDTLLSFIKREPFGILVSVDGGAPVATHVPIVVLEDAAALVLGLHVAKGMQAGIVGVRIRVSRIEGVCKYSQNRTADDRARVAEALNRSPRAMDREVAREIQTRA